MITLYRIIKFGLQGFWRNFALSFNATFILTLTLVTLSIFFALNLLVLETTNNLESRLDLTIFLHDSAQPQEVESFVKTIKAQSTVKQVVFIDKPQLLEEWRKLYKNEPDFRDLITAEDNPFLREVRVKTYDPSNLKKIASFTENDNYKVIVSKISFQENQEKIITFINLSKLLRKVSLFISLIFALISLLVTFTTIRLMIFSRREEIEIMRLVGANNLLVRAPFILEGVFYGILATIFAEIIALLAFWSLGPLENEYLKDSTVLVFGQADQSLLSLFESNLNIIIVVHLAAAVLIGITSSTLAVRKYLK